MAPRIRVTFCFLEGQDEEVTVESGSYIHEEMYPERMQKGRIPKLIRVEGIPEESN